MTFDGVVCFGGSDWWYHNRGHYDIQMMRQFSRHVPVLYVNSLGVRLPRLGAGKMFLPRIARKLRSICRGFVRLEERFGVLSPVALPGALGVTASRSLLRTQIALASRRLGISRPLVWVECPPAAAVIDRIHPAAVLYQRTDRYEEFPDVDREAIRAFDQRLKERADLTLFCSSLLYAEESAGCRCAQYVDHGVDFDQFAAAGDGLVEEPADVRDIPRSRVGFIGGIDSHTFDQSLFLQVARQMPDAHFVMVGGCTFPDGWCTLPNVHLLGQRPYDRVAAYMAACDVLIMPWNQNEWIKACNPVKLKEYLAVGRPVVTTDFAELRRYDGYVYRAKGAAEFADCIGRALRDRPDIERLRKRVRGETWQAKAANVLAMLAQRDVTCAVPQSELSLLSATA